MRQELHLKPGAEFEVEVVDGKIVLQPILRPEALQQPLAQLRQIVQNVNVQDELEAEREQELNRERYLEQLLGSWALDATLQ